MAFIVRMCFVRFKHALDPNSSLLARRRRLPLFWPLLCAALALGGWAAFYGWINGDARRAWLRSEAQEQLARAAPGATLGGELAISALGRVRLGPLWIAQSRGAEPWLYADWVEIRPSYRSLLSAHPQAAQVTLFGVRLRGGLSRSELEESLKPLKERTAPSKVDTSMAAPSEGRSIPRDPPRVAAHALTFGCAQLPRPPDRPSEVCPRGPFEGLMVLEHPRERVSLRVEVIPPGGGRARFVVSPDGDGARAEVRIERLEAKELLQGLSPQLRSPTTAGTATAELEARLPSRDGKRGSAQLELRLADFSFQGGRLAPEPFGPLGLILRANVDWELEKDPRLELKRLDLALGDKGPRVELDGTLKLSGQAPVNATLRLLPVPFQAILASLPPSFRPAAEAPQLLGELSGQLALSGPLRTPRQLVVQGGLDLSRLKEAPANGKRRTFDGPFIFAPVDKEGREHETLVGPDNPNYAPLESVPPYLLSAITVSEDAGFFSHHGFDFDEIKNSLVDAMEQGKLRGASTLTQQLAKNLFLSRERTLARKVREALVTITLEAAVPKRRLLEIYINMIEWGPGIYGIGAASRHYFGKPPSQLTPKEAVYLASIIPGPSLYYSYFRKGALSPTWERRVDDLLAKLWRVGAIDQVSYDQARATPIRFAGAGAEAAPEPTDSSEIPDLPEPPEEPPAETWDL